MIVRRLKVSINRSLIGKDEPGDKRAYSHGWEEGEHTLEELGSAIQLGYAYGPQWNGPRKAANFACSDIAVVDMDHANSLGRFLAVSSSRTMQRSSTQRFRIRPSAPREGHIRAAADDLPRRRIRGAEHFLGP